MQKWEYKVLLRGRGIEKYGNIFQGKDWETAIGDEFKSVDIEEYVNTLGEQGWELVSVLPLSHYLGADSSISGFTAFGGGRTDGVTRDYAGFTSHEKWVFKRPKS